MFNRLMLGAASALLIGGAAQAATINVSTGLDAGGHLLTAGDSADANWTVTGAHSPLDPVNHTAYVTTPSNADFFGDWKANGSNSDWIAANPDSTGGNGLMTFTRTFNLSNPGSASLTGAWAIDDGADLLLNGHTIASLSSGAWGGLTPFSAPSADFVTGLNTLTIKMTQNDDYIEAARLEGTVTYTPAVAGVPEPASWAMMIVGFLGAGALLRRKREALAGV